MRQTSDWAAPAAAPAMGRSATAQWSEAALCVVTVMTCKESAEMEGHATKSFQRWEV